jgi:hypothetical protein
MKTAAVRAGLAVMLAGATALATPAPGAAAATKEVTKLCAADGFGGSFTFRYTTSGGYHHPQSTRTSSGPYIGDSGVQLLRIYYHDGLSTHTVYTRTGATDGSAQSETLPTALAIPVTARGFATANFGDGTVSCTATVAIT